MKKGIFIILLLGLSGCGFVFQSLNEQGYENLTYKMSKDEVIRMMGAPQKESKLTIEDKEYEVWEYPKKGSTSRKISSLATSYSKVFFLDGKVVQWDEDRVYAQPGYDFQETISPEEKVTINKISEANERLK